MNLTRSNTSQISDLVRHYRENQSILQTFLGQLQSLLVNSKALAPHVHSFKWRLKDPERLRTKLRRKPREAAEEPSDHAPITKDNLFVRVTDLVGVRILHLHSRQIQAIDRNLQDLLAEARYTIVEGPSARTWDDETNNYFKSIGIHTQESGPSMYTSVHYVIDSNSRTRLTAELQVRTLAEELWGEVSHIVDYPRPCRSLACQEQIRVLARITSGCTRLVDAIFRTYEEFTKRSPVRQKAARPR